MDWWQVFPSNYDVQSENDPPAWFLYIVEGDKLWEVDLRQRLPQVIFEKQGLISLSMLNALQSTVQKASTPSAANNSWQRSLFRTVADDSYSIVHVAESDSGEKKNRPKYSNIVGLRADDRIILYDPISTKNWQFKLPKESPNKSFSVYWIASDQLLVGYNSGSWSGGHIDKLVWIDSNGNVTKETEVQLAGQVPDSPRAIAWHFVGITPVAIAWLFVVAVALPFSMLQDHKATTFGDAISQSFEIAWPPLLVAFAIAAILAWITIRAQ